MKFGIAKHDNLFCYKCGSSILYGEHYVGFFFSKELGGRVIRKSLIFHIDQCYLKWNEEMFTKKYLNWRMNLNPPKKRGRPIKSINPKEYRRLKAQLRHHQKAGNWDRVKELEGKIKELALDK